MSAENEKDTPKPVKDNPAKRLKDVQAKLDKGQSASLTIHDNIIIDF